MSYDLPPQENSNVISFADFVNVKQNAPQPAPVVTERLGREREYVRMDDGSLRRVTPKKGKQAPIDWRERCIKAEKFFLGLVEERKKIQNLILEACRKIDELGFEADLGKLIDFDPYMELKAFAKGVPHLTRAPLEEMPLDGTRVVKRTIKSDRGTDLFLECGHELNMSPDAIPPQEKTTICPECVATLKERGLYVSGEKPAFTASELKAGD